MQQISKINSTYKRPKVFTWHIHGTYLYYLSQGNYDLYIPTRDDKAEGYYGKGETFPFGPNVHEVPAEEVKNLDLDCIIFQSKNNYLKDQYDILSAEQRELPRIYLEHDPPREVPTDTKHVVDDPDVLLVHVTHFNCLMWDNNSTPTHVIDHGVVDPGVSYTGEIERGIVVINNIQKRGRRLGLDVFLELKKHVPLDLVGMGAEELGLGEVKYQQLPEFISKYRFFFNPIRYTSLGLSICEAMTIGVPVVGLATTELVTVIQNGVSGYVHTDIYYLAERMKELLQNKELAVQLGREGQKIAKQRFNIQRFATDWDETIQKVIAARAAQKSPVIIKSVA
ncbi:glycosyltransferase family 4 protein [Pedobacter sp. SYSU D00535]|uniref:glycosyltransferase family 4 protein n=1 Tax=Pedobacter sp. SYSU D00535 TaxID=2810308 RepID=UPI001A97AE3E|nr:glycosyltransferase family 4 protein [Pedobacter sp. SYSU D00535]